MENCPTTQLPNLPIPTLNDENDLKLKYFLRQILVCAGLWIINFVNGMGLGGPTVFIPQIRKEANSTEVISEAIAPLFVSIYWYASVPWIIILPVLAAFIGRKKPYILVCAAMLISATTFYTSTSVTQIFVSEVIEAIATASITTMAPLVLTEYTSPKYRGFFLCFKAATLLWGIWVSNAIGTYFHWKFIGLVKVILSIFPLILLIFWPESPYWLASKGKLAECAKSHRWLKGNSKNCELELQRLISNINNGSHSQLPIRYILQKEFYKPTLIGICSSLAYSFSGKIACGFYSLVIIRKMTSNENIAYTGMLILDGVTVLAMYIGTILSRYMTRRALFFSSTTVAIVSLYVLSLYVYLVSLSVLPEDKYISITLLSLYSIGTGCGPILFSGLFSAELLPLKRRSLAMYFICIPLSVTMGLTTQMTSIIMKSLGLGSCFLFFGVTLSICTVILYFFLPETKDKSLHEIADHIKESSSASERNALINC